jgi:glycine dehydrogenase subunit 1
MSLLGAKGLYQMAAKAHSNTSYLLNKLKEVSGIKQVFHSPFFHEIVLQFDTPVSTVLERLSKEDILAGYALTEDYPELGECLLICATETKTHEDLDLLINFLNQN